MTSTDAEKRATAAILAAPRVRTHREMTVYYNLDSPVDIDLGDHGRVRITQLRASAIYYDDEPLPTIEAHAFSRRLTARNTVSERDGDYWRKLPRELATELLGASLLPRQ